jgi:hypothetical protein
VLTTQLQPFFPVSNATLLLNQSESGNRVGTGLALVNREQVLSFTLS